MKYNFDEIIPRRGTQSYKWDTPSRSDILPMWVADMDFRTAPSVIDALQKRVEHGIFGYTKVPQAYYDAVINWFDRRHGLHIRREWIIYTTGVVPALSAIIKALTSPGDRILVQTPAYNCFFSSIRNNQCVLADNRLQYRDGKYSIDFDDLESKASDPAVKLMLLCNPHNPSGRVWSREELTEMARICLKNDVFVVADEIHCELVHPGVKYTPFASLSRGAQMNSVTCLSPSKAFNLAGIQVANIVAADESVRLKIDKAININEVCDINAFAVNALIAAYNEGEEWLEELKIYLHGNYRMLMEYFNLHLPQFPVLPLEGTYLVWMDCSASGRTGDIIARQLLEQAGLMVSARSMYGESGKNFIRLNIACPRQILQQGLDRLKSVLAHSQSIPSRR